MTHQEAWAAHRERTARDRALRFARDAEGWDWNWRKHSLRGAKGMVQNSAEFAGVALRFGRVEMEVCPTDKIQSSCLIYWEGQTMSPYGRRGTEMILGELVRDSRGYWKYYHNA